MPTGQRSEIDWGVIYSPAEADESKREKHLLDLLLATEPVLIDWISHVDDSKSARTLLKRVRKALAKDYGKDKKRR